MTTTDALASGSALRAIAGPSPLPGARCPKALTTMIACMTIPHRQYGISSPPHECGHDLAEPVPASSADADERLDASPDKGAAKPARFGVTTLGTGDGAGDRSTALTMIDSPFRCPIQSHPIPSRVLRDCPANRRT